MLFTSAELSVGSSKHSVTVFTASDSVKCSLPGMIMLCGASPKSLLIRFEIFPETIF